MRQQLCDLKAGQDIGQALGRAETRNALIRVRNHFITPSSLSAVQKTVCFLLLCGGPKSRVIFKTESYHLHVLQVPGSGLLRARALAPSVVVVRNQFDNYAANNPDPAADIGSTPGPLLFQPDIDNYNHFDCLKLIFFYNEDMGIVARSELPERKKAIKSWLSNF